MDALQTLNKEFGIPDRLEFVEGPGGFTIARINSPLATAEISLHGGQVLRFQPAGEEPVLWVSPDSEYAANRAIRGGIPVCWPWFGSHPTAPDFPKHGFARLNEWHVVGAETLPGGEIRLRLILPQINSHREWWPQPFILTVYLTVGRELEVRLIARNPGPESYRMTAALHSYFVVSDAEAVTIEGLKGKIYLDLPAGGMPRLQEDEVIFRGEVDRVYLDTAGACTIVDAGLKRRIHVEKLGSRSSVVWNPGEEKVKTIKDFTNQQWRKVVCLETANAASDAVEIAPGGTHELGTTIRVERIA